MGLKQTMAPAVEPVSLLEVAAHLRVDAEEEEEYLLTLISASRFQAEVFCNRQFITTQWQLSLEDFPCWSIELPWPRLQSVESIEYVDTNGDLQTLADTEYVVVTDEEPGRVAPAYGKLWPTVRCGSGAVLIGYTSGYGSDPADVPAAVRHGIKVIVATHYENRESVITGTVATEIPGTAKSLLSTVKIPKIA